MSVRVAYASANTLECTVAASTSSEKEEVRQVDVAALTEGGNDIVGLVSAMGGAALIAATAKGNVAVWVRARNNELRLVRLLTAHAYGCTTIVSSPCGQYVATCGKDATCLIMSVAALVKPWAAVGSDGQQKKKNEKRKKADKKEDESKDEAESQSIVLPWGPAEIERALSTGSWTRLRGHTLAVTAAVFCAGRPAIVTCGLDGRIIEHTLGGEQRFAVLGPNGARPLRYLAISPDESILYASGSDAKASACFVDIAVHSRPSMAAVRRATAMAKWRNNVSEAETNSSSSKPTVSAAPLRFPEEFSSDESVAAIVVPKTLGSKVVEVVLRDGTTIVWAGIDGIGDVAPEKVEEVVSEASAAPSATVTGTPQAVARASSTEAASVSLGWGSWHAPAAALSGGMSSADVVTLTSGLLHNSGDVTVEAEDDDDTAGAPDGEGLPTKRGRKENSANQTAEEKKLADLRAVQARLQKVCDGLFSQLKAIEDADGS